MANTPKKRGMVPRTIGDVIRDLRRAMGRVSPSIRETMLEAIEAIDELARRLNAAQEGRRQFWDDHHRQQESETVHVEVNPLSPFHVTPRATAVITEIQEPE